MTEAAAGPAPKIPDLLAATAELVDVPSVSHHEKVLADLVESRLRGVPGLEVRRIADNVVARSDLGRRERVVLAGHLDTVPANGNDRSRRDGSTVWGLGSADMKGGLAVMLALAAEAVSRRVDVTYVFYSGEEVARQYNGLLQIADADPGLLEGDAAILGEPTGAVIEAGCQGVLRVDVTLGGKRAHTARPWMGVNAIHRLGSVLDRVQAFEARQPVIDGCRYREAIQVTRVEGGVAPNVVPDSVSITVNHRFAPDRDVARASEVLLSWLDPVLDRSLGDRAELTDSSPSAAPSLTHPVLASLLDATGSPVRAKLGWTDVAFFSERGIPAVNFGPGDPELAHTAGEKVTATELDRAYTCLSAVLGGAPAGS